jgi:hypothetical protein
MWASAWRCFTPMSSIEWCEECGRSTKTGEIHYHPPKMSECCEECGRSTKTGEIHYHPPKM